MKKENKAAVGLLICAGLNLCMCVVSIIDSHKAWKKMKEVKEKKREALNWIKNADESVIVLGGEDAQPGSRWLLGCLKNELTNIRQVVESL